MLGVLIGSLVGVLLGYFATDYREWRQQQQKKQMLLTLLLQELSHVPRPMHPYDEAGVYHLHPVDLPALTALFDGSTLDGGTPYYVVSELLRLRTVVHRYNSYVTVSNFSNPHLLSNPSHHRANYNILEEAHELLINAADDASEVLRIYSPASEVHTIRAYLTW